MSEEKNQKEGREEMKNNHNKKSSVVLKRRMRLKLHCRLKTRFIINVLSFIILILLLSFTIPKALIITKSEIIAYKENSDINYKVYLNNNSFYDTPYLEKDMAYVASLINNIKIKYNYTFESSKENNLDIQYKIIAKLVIASQNNSNVFYEKEYELTKTVIDEMVDKKIYRIDRDVDIDYQYYNNLANQFRANYAVYTNSYLDVYLEVEEKNKEEYTYKLNNLKKASITIPLTEQEINMKVNNIADQEQIITKTEIKRGKILYIIISLILIVLMLWIIISFMKKLLLLTRKKLSPYDKYIRKLLISYDRIIINVKTRPDKSDYNVIEVENFQELVDARDNTKEPINYHIIKEHQRCEFFVINDNNMYIYEPKATDFNEEDKNGKDSKPSKNN